MTKQNNILTDAIINERVNELLLNEAEYLDDRRWHDWLGLYEEDAVYWAPSWDDDENLIDNPRNEISLIYCEGRDRLEERIWRIESGLSSSLLRLPRTRHFLTGIRVRAIEGNEVTVTANFQVNTYKLKEQRTDIFFGHYQYRLVDKGSDLKIRQKFITVCNDLIPGQMDIFNI